MESHQPHGGCREAGPADDQGFRFQALLLLIWQILDERLSGNIEETPRQNVIKYHKYHKITNYLIGLELFS